MAARAQYAPRPPSQPAPQSAHAEAESAGADSPRRPQRSQQQQHYPPTPLRATSILSTDSEISVAPAASSPTDAATSATVPSSATAPVTAPRDSSSSSSGAGSKGSISFSAHHALRLPPPHEPWGVRYEHPTIHHVTRTGTSSPRKLAHAHHHHHTQADATAAHSEDDSGAEPLTSRSARGNTNSAAQVSSITSRLVATVVPPAAPYTAFSEASRYQEIIRPPSSPRAMLLGKLVRPKVPMPPAQLAAGLPIQVPQWQVTAKVRARGGSTRPGEGAMVDAVEARMHHAAMLHAEGDEGGNDPRHSGGAASNHPRSPEAVRRSVKHALAQRRAHSSLVHATHALDFTSGVLSGGDGEDNAASAPGAPPAASSSALVDTSQWGHALLTPRPKTSNDPRGRREVLAMLQAHRNTPRGAQVLALKERERQIARDREYMHMLPAQTAGGGSGGGGDHAINDAGAAAALLHLQSETEDDDAPAALSIGGGNNNSSNSNGNGFDAQRLRMASAPSGLQGGGLRPSSRMDQPRAQTRAGHGHAHGQRHGHGHGGRAGHHHHHHAHAHGRSFSTTNGAAVGSGQHFHFSPFSPAATGAWGHAVQGGGRASSAASHTPAPGFYPASTSSFLGGGGGGGASSSSAVTPAPFAGSFHGALAGGARPSHHGAPRGVGPSHLSFHRVQPPAFMNVPPRVEPGAMGSGSSSDQQSTTAAAAAATSKARVERIRLVAQGNAASLAASNYAGPLVPDRAAAVKSLRAKSAGGVSQMRDGSQSARSHRHHFDEKESSQANSGSSTARSRHVASSSSSSPPLTTLPLPSDLDVSLTHARLRDFELRALACNRAGRRSAEANALFCMGVLWDNIREHGRAIECYRKFKDILCTPREAADRAAATAAAYARGEAPPPHTSQPHATPFLRTAEEQFAEALAHNCMGISSQLQGTPEGYAAALWHHARHRDLADLPGQFVAHTNLGLVYQLMAADEAAKVEASFSGASPDTFDGDGDGGDDEHSAALARQRALTEQAAFAHQSALRCALHMSSLAGQNIAIGNLGLTGLQHRDLQTARACMERHLQLSHSLHDYAGQSSAYQALGAIASREGAHEQARLHFQAAWQVAEVLQDAVTADQAKVQLGVAIANADMEQRMREAAKAACAR